VVARAAGNPVLASLLTSLATRTMRARLWHGRTADRALDETRAEHRRIYEAIMASDPELARAAATAHIASSERWLRGQLAAGISS
jgi:GntR family transcriptional regulator, transcriptional repressor for pyruvate dehydrogenase complex